MLIRNPSFLIAGTFRWALIGTVWGASVFSGFYLLARYASTPGERGSRGRLWPSGCHLPLDPTRPTLLMFLHPRCPCSRSSLSELERILAYVGRRVEPHVLVYRPMRVEAGWESTALRDRAAAIPNVHVWTDVGGVEAERFDANTSGLVLLYYPDGGLIFQGGITSLRAHEGDNAGSRAVKRMVVCPSRDLVETPVFGCPLSNHLPM
jgi:hypothetical protein